MMRTFLWMIGGLGLGMIIHLIVILSLPSLATENIWTRITAMDSFEKIVVLEDIVSHEPNPLRLDPELIYGVCRLDLSKGIGVINAHLPDAFWSVSVFDSLGQAVYGTTNRSGISQILQLGIFNKAQIRLLATQQLDIEEGLLIVEAQSDDLFVIVRLSPPHQAMRERYKNRLHDVVCGHV